MPSNHLVLLVPGSPTALTDLLPLATRLALRPDVARVEVVEPPGYGRTPAAGGTMSARMEHLLGLWRSLPAARTTVIGYSAGAYDALAATAAGATFDRVVLLEGTVGPLEEERPAYRQLADTIRRGELSREALAQRLLAPQNATQRVLVERAAAWLDATSTENLAGEVSSFGAAPNLSEVAVALGSALRVVHAEHDVVMSLAAARALAERAGSPCIVLDGLGHACFLEDPDAVAAALGVALD